MKTCDPITIAGAALTIGSTVANTVANNKIQAARNDALAAERIRQAGYDKEAQALNVQSQDRYQGFEGQQDQRGQQLGDYFQSQQVSRGAADQSAAEEQARATMPDASGITIAEDQKQSAAARDFTNKQGAALGQLRAFGDLLGEVGRYQARDASQIGQIGGFKRGSASILPYELEASNSAGDGAKAFGDLAAIGGQVALGYGLQGGMTTPSLGYNSPSVVGTVGSLARGRAADRSSVPGYSGYSLYG